jgi:hypothetical protein
LIFLLLEFFISKYFIPSISWPLTRRNIILRHRVQ